MKIGSIWISGGLHYTWDKFERRYNWTHSPDGSDTSLDSIFRSVYIIELAIL